MLIPKLYIYKEFLMKYGYKEYSQIKLLIDKYCEMKESKRYEDFINELSAILKL